MPWDSLLEGFNKLADSAGIALAFSLFLNVYQALQNRTERKDRREAWSKYNTVLEGNNPVILGNTLAIENSNRIEAENTKLLKDVAKTLEGVKCHYSRKD